MGQRKISAELIGGPNDGRKIQLVISDQSEAIRYAIPEGSCRHVYGGVLRVDRPFVRLEYLGKECDPSRVGE